MKRNLLFLILLGICFCGTSAFAEGVDAYTELLLHNDNLSFTDSSPYNHSVTSHGVQADPVVKKFGTGSALFQGGDYLTIPDSNGWNFGTGDFTIDFWAKLNVKDTDQVLFSQYEDDDSYLQCWTNGGNRLLFRAVNGPQVAYYYSPNGSINTGQWYHIAYARNGSNFYTFLNGTSLSLSEVTPISTNDLGGLAGTIRIGWGNASMADWYLNGYLDEIRISKGVARWTSDFTPPTEPYSAGIIPEPATVSLLGLGLFGLAFKKRKISK